MAEMDEGHFMGGQAKEFTARDSHIQMLFRNSNKEALQKIGQWGQVVGSLKDNQNLLKE